MAYDVYTLAGYVLEVKDVGEFDKRIVFFSKDHGVVSVLAVGTARPASKLRGFLMRFARIDIDVVHGKSGYRLVRAKSGESGFVVHKKNAYIVLARIAELLRVLLPEHAPHEPSFRVFEEVSTYLENTIVSDEKIDSLYYTAALQLLTALGYRKEAAITDGLASMRAEYEHILYENQISLMV